MRKLRTQQCSLLWVSKSQLFPCPLALWRTPSRMAGVGTGDSWNCCELHRCRTAEPNLFLDVCASLFSHLAAGIHSSAGPLSRAAQSASSLHQLCDKVGQKGGETADVQDKHHMTYPGAILPGLSPGMLCACLWEPKCSRL